MASRQLGERALVAGAGIGGLAAAAAISPFFGRVEVVEKDRLPLALQPRRGVAQGFHGHVFLVGGQRSLEQLFPGIIDDFRAAGALMADFTGDFDICDYGMARPRRPLGLVMACLSRPAYEWILRARAEERGNVRVEDGVKTSGVAFEDGKAVGLAVDGKVRRADFVVDATGRGAALAAQLEQAGFGRTPEITIGVNVCYVSARFRLAERWGPCAPALCIPAPPDRGFGVVLPIEGGEHLVSIGGRCGLEPPTDLAGFVDFAHILASPAIAERLAGATQVTPLLRYRKPTSDWRRYDLLERFPAGLAPAGDTIASFNPTFAQGMTVAIRHALALGEALAETNGVAPDFARRYLPAAAAHSEEAWTGAAIIDLAYPEVTGERPPGFEEMRQFLAGLRRLADMDPEVHQLEAEVMHMARHPSAFEEPALQARAMQALAPVAAAGEPFHVPNPVAG